MRAGECELQGSAWVPVLVDMASERQAIWSWGEGLFEPEGEVMVVKDGATSFEATSCYDDCEGFGLASSVDDVGSELVWLYEERGACDAAAAAVGQLAAVHNVMKAAEAGRLLPAVPQLLSADRNTAVVEESADAVVGCLLLAW